MKNDQLTHIDLFSGIGGFALAADRVWPGIRHVFCDNEPFAQEVLKKHWPEAPIYGDIRTLKWKGGRPFILTGGFPCQPFSSTGAKRGKSDDRYLWPEMFRVIREAMPHWIIGENVDGIIKMALDDVLADLESIGYSARAFIIPACAIGAHHRRNRVWIVANSERERLPRRILERGDTPAIIPSPLGIEGFEDTEWATWDCSPELPLLAYGLSEKLDEPQTVALGNAIVPQVAEEIMHAIQFIRQMNDHD